MKHDVVLSIDLKHITSGLTTACKRVTYSVCEFLCCVACTSVLSHLLILLLFFFFFLLTSKWGATPVLIIYCDVIVSQKRKPTSSFEFRSRGSFAVNCQSQNVVGGRGKVRLYCITTSTHTHTQSIFKHIILRERERERIALENVRYTVRYNYHCVQSFELLQFLTGLWT